MPYTDTFRGHADKRHRIIGAESFAKVARRIKGRWLESAFARTEMEEERVLDYRRSDPQYVNEQNVKSPPRVKYPYLWQANRKKVGWLWQQLGLDPSWRTVTPAAREYRDKGPLLTRVLEQNLALPHHDMKKANDVVLLRYLNMGLKYGLSYITARWEEDPEWWGVRHEHVRWEDVYFDWKAARWQVVRSYTPVHSVLEQVMALVDIPVIDPDSKEEVPNAADLIAGNAEHLLREVEKGTTSMHRYDHWYSVDANRHQRDIGRVSDDDEYGDTFWVDPGDDPLNMRVPVLEYHERRRHGFVIKVIPAFGANGEDLLLACHPSPYRFNQLIPFVPFWVDDEEQGNSLSYTVGHLDEVLSFSLRKQLRFFARWADPAVLYRSGVRIRRQDQEILSNRTIEVEDKDDITVLDAPSAAGMHQMAMMLTRTVMDEGIAESQQRRGQVDEGTATGQRIAQQNSTIDDGLIALCAKHSLRQLSYLTLEIMRNHLTTEKSVAMHGLEGGLEIMELKPEYLQTSHVIQLQPQLVAASPEEKAAAVLSAFERFGPAVMDPTKSYMEYARLLDIRGDALLAQMQTVKPKDPKIEHHAMMFLNQGVVPSPRENVQEHLMKHYAFESEIQRSLPPEHPAHKLIREHIMLTEQMLQMQQQAMGGGGGGAGTPQRVGPGEAPHGGPGNQQTPSGASQLQQMRTLGGAQGAQTPFAGGREAVVTR